MLRGLLKDKKVYDFANSKGKGKKTNLYYSHNSPYQQEIKIIDANKIYSPSGVSLTGKLNKRVNQCLRSSNEVTFSPSKKIFPEKQVNSLRTIYPNLQDLKEKDLYKSTSLLKITSFLNDYNHNKPTDLFNLRKNVSLKREKFGKKILNDKVGNFEFSDEPVKFSKITNSGKK